MTCQECRQDLHAFLDGELNSSRSTLISEHIAECPGCQAVVEAQTRLSGAIKRYAVGATAPGSIAAGFKERTRKKKRFKLWLFPVALATAIAAFLIGFVWQPWKLTAARVSSDLIDNHLATIGDACHVKVNSANPNMVMKWFTANHLGFLPVVKDLSADALTLVGGRIDRVDGQIVAAFVYKVNNIPITVYTASSALPGSQDLDKDGVQVRSWSDCGLNYWAVSKAGGQYLESIHRDLLGRKY